jgi:hypothetical protein
MPPPGVECQGADLIYIHATVGERIVHGVLESIRL